MNQEAVFQVNAAVLANEPLSADCRRMTLDAPEIASAACPGQFVHIRIAESNDPLLRRPFSIFRTSKTGAIQVVYRVSGRGTRIMARLQPGDRLDVLGPLGHGFAVSPEKKAHVLVGGGTGAAGLFLLGEEITRQKGQELIVLLGAETGDCLILEEDFRALDGSVMVSTDDGTRGYHGLATEMLRDALANGRIPPDCAVYACGPRPMLKALADICREYRLPAQVALEKHMMCGIGACMVCVCRINKAGVLQHRGPDSGHIALSPDGDWGYALACSDGPVFHVDEVDFDE